MGCNLVGEKMGDVANGGQERRLSIEGKNSNWPCDKCAKMRRQENKLAKGWRLKGINTR